MAAIARFRPAEAVGLLAIAKTALTGADTLTYSTSVSQTLYLENTTASAVTVVIDGDGGTTFTPGGIGATINLQAGFSAVVPANGSVAVTLRNISQFLKGTVAVTGGTGVNAWIQE